MYVVQWSRRFQNWLNGIWDEVGADERYRIANAINLLSHKLSRDPLGNSESREGRRRVSIEAPLTVHFEIDHEKDIVSVLSGVYIQ